MRTISQLRHDLRTPLNHILGYSEIVAEDAPPEWAPMLEAIDRSAREAMAAVADLPADGSIVEALRGPVGSITSCVEALRERGGSESLMRDLDRIEAAAHALIEIASGEVEEEPVAAAVPESEPVEQAFRARVLVCDDNAANRSLLRRRLRREGCEVREAADGAQAIEALKEGAFDLLLLDIVMPVMDGFQVLAALKEERRLRTLPVIVISAVDEVKIAARAIEMGAEDFLFKPFDPVLLRARINASLEKRRLRGELATQERLASLGAFTAGIAHEIKNPLNFITNFAELSAELAERQSQALEGLRGAVPAATLEELLETAADLRQNLAKIREHGSRADSIVRSMLAHSRGQSGERRPTDVNALAREFVNLAFHGMRAQDPGFQTAVRHEYDPTAGLIDAVPQDLSRAILNVASNAFYAVLKRAQAQPQGYEPEVRLRTRNLGDRVEVRIRDNGPGIAPAVMRRVFDPFFTTKPAGEGTGLGLSLSHEIVVEEHGGDMRVESEEGRYTEFVMTLPRASGAGEPQ